MNYNGNNGKAVVNSRYTNAHVVTFQVDDDYRLSKDKIRLFRHHSRDSNSNSLSSIQLPQEMTLNPYDLLCQIISIPKMFKNWAEYIRPLILSTFVWYRIFYTVLCKCL